MDEANQASLRLLQDSRRSSWAEFNNQGRWIPDRLPSAPQRLREGIISEETGWSWTLKENLCESVVPVRHPPERWETADLELGETSHRSSICGPWAIPPCSWRGSDSSVPSLQALLVPLRRGLVL